LRRSNIFTVDATTLHFTLYNFTLQLYLTLQLYTLQLYATTLLDATTLYVEVRMLIASVHFTGIFTDPSKHFFLSNVMLLKLKIV
jgi:hypothetical protein